MRFLILTIVLLSNVVSYGQNNYVISFEDEKIVDFENREFFIETIIDKNNKHVFTYSKLNNGNRLIEIIYETDLQTELKFLLLKSFPAKKDQLGLTLIIEALSATENYGKTGNELKITFQAQLLLESEVLYTNRFEKVFTENLDYENYPYFIAQTIQGYFYDFAMIEEIAHPKEIIDKEGEEGEEPTTSSESNKTNINIFEEVSSRDVVAIGYQIGGFNLIGIDYEFRATDVLGIHAGIGFKGYTAGVKLHFRSTKDGGFINVSFKDGGFGLIKAYAVEYGSRRAFSKNKGSFGFHYQIGLAMVTEIDPDLSRILGSSEDPPFVMLSLGVGFSW